MAEKRAFQPSGAGAAARTDHGMRLHVVVQCISDLRGYECIGQVELQRPGRGMYARVGTACDGAGDRRAVAQSGGCGFQHFLDGQSGGLALPANEWGTVGIPV